MPKNTKQILQISALSFFFILITGYGFWGSHNLIFGVRITDVTINEKTAQSGAKFANPALKLQGNAKNAVKLTLNGREITINEQGDFNETLVLLPGYNIINIIAKDKFGYIDEKNYKLMH